MQSQCAPECKAPVTCVCPSRIHVQPKQGHHGVAPDLSSWQGQGKATTFVHEPHASHDFGGLSDPSELLQDQWYTRVKSDEAGKAFKEDCIYEGRHLSFL